MMQDEHDYDLSRDLGTRALGYLKELQAAPDPLGYALLYHHAAGYDQALSATLAELIRDRHSLPPHDVHRLHEAFVSSSRQIDPLRQSLSESAAHTADALTAMEEATAGLSASLQEVDLDHAASQGPEEAAAAIRSLMLASTVIARRHRQLEEELAQSARQVDDLKQCIATVRGEGQSDPLTRLPARRHFRQAVAAALEGARQDDEPLCLLMVDIDKFRSYNEVHGRIIGDKVLRLMADVIRAKLGGRHMVARYAGDQFAILLSNTRLETAVRLAEELRASVLGMKFVRKGSGRSVGRITVSAGVALFAYGDTSDSLIARALHALATAKHLGRNRVRSVANAGTVEIKTDG